MNRFEQNSRDDLGPLAGLNPDLSREGVVEEIQGLMPRQQAELVTLMWLGRGDREPEEWDELVARAVERRAVPTENYLLDPPLLAEHWLATAWSGLALAASAAGPSGDEGEPTPRRPSPHHYISSSSLAQDGR